MRGKTPSPAFLALEAAVKARERAISVTQLERWCYWRRGDGLIDRPIRRGAGRGTRSSFSDLDRAASQALAVDDMLRPGDSLDLVALRLAAAGAEINPSAIRDALVAVLSAFETRLARDAHADKTDDPIELASNVGLAAHKMFTRGERSCQRREAQLTSDHRLWSAAGRVLLGQPLLIGEARELLDRTGISPFFDLLGLPPEAFGEAIGAFTEKLSLRAARQAAEARSPGEAVAALRFARALTDLLARVMPHVVAPRSQDTLLVGAAGFTLALFDEIPGVPNSPGPPN